MCEVNTIIRSSVFDFFNSNWSYKDFLTEEDIRCNLFLYLKIALDINKRFSVHSEVRWYAKDETAEEIILKFRSDLVILDSTTLNVENIDNIRLPSKGYAFNEYVAIIEIKLRRSNSSVSDRKFETMIQKDVDKSIKIHERMQQYSSDNIKDYYILVFDKLRKQKKIINVYDERRSDWVDWLCE